MPYFSPFINFSIRRIGNYNYTMLQSTHRLLGRLNTCKWMPDFSHCIDVSSDALIETWHNLFAMFNTWQRKYTMFQSAHLHMAKKLYHVSISASTHGKEIIPCFNQRIVFMGGKYASTSHGVEYENRIIQCLNF